MSGELLFIGGTCWDLLGRKTTEADLAKEPNVAVPSRISTFVDAGKKFKSVGVGVNSCHCIAIDVDGNVYAWGRNDHGQLGVGDCVKRHAPTKVEFKGFKGKCIAAASGKYHSLFLMDDGSTFACGTNKYGQLGLGSCKKMATPKEEELVMLPKETKGPEGTKSIACSEESSFWLTVDGQIYSCGMPEHGVLGHGTTNEYNTKASSIKLAFDPQPSPKSIAAFREKDIVKMAVGATHAAAVDSKGDLYTWGCGDFGRLGHKVQKDELAPRLIERVFNRNQVITPHRCVLACGTMTTFVTSPEGALYHCGKTKVNGEAAMYFKPLDGMGNYITDVMACGNGTFFISSKPNRATIAWGGASNSELGYGEMGKKSSTVPGLIPSMDGLETLHVAAGNGFVVLIVNTDAEADLAKVKAMPVYTPPTGPEEKKKKAPKTDDKSNNSNNNAEKSEKKRPNEEDADGPPAKKTKE